MTAAWVDEVGAVLGVAPDLVGGELRRRLDAVLTVAPGLPASDPGDGGGVHADLDALAGFVAAVRLDLPIAYLAVDYRPTRDTGTDHSTDRPAVARPRDVATAPSTTTGLGGQS
ncbi:MAG: hypothetical protein ACRCTR_09640 [Actinomycetota bacterium]